MDIGSRAGLRLVTLGLLGLVQACASVAEPPAPPAAGGVPGFDTRDYPGADAMRTWRDASPYRWVGYYLPAPCYTGATWVGRRAELERMGWGLAVVFVGEQDWDATEGPATLADPEGGSPSCTRANLTPERGAADARAAEDAASAEGFLRGTTLYLDVERVDAVSPELVAYVRAWTEALAGSGRYEAGLYAHARNAPQLHAVVSTAAARAGRVRRPRLWVAGTGDFDLRASPAASGVEWANVWQGLFDVTETWGGVSLLIDVNVADGPDPSGSGPG